MILLEVTIALVKFELYELALLFMLAGMKIVIQWFITFHTCLYNSVK
jgi:hypothetical protein